MSNEAPSRAVQAVILAAGRGSRLGHRTDEIPKALLPIGPRSRSDATETCFLRRQCEMLREVGVDETIVVVGYLREMIVEAVKGWDLGIKIVVNNTADITASGSLHSFQFAARSEHGVLDGRCQTMLMDADIVYHRRALKQFVEGPVETAMLISARYDAGTEEVLVWGEVAGRAPRFLGKGLNADLTLGAACLGEATGIVKFAPADHHLARITMDWMLGDPDQPEGSARWRGFGPARRATEHEELTQRMMVHGKVRAVSFDEALPFMEVDSEQEYAHLRNVLYPRLLELEAEG